MRQKRCNGATRGQLGAAALRECRSNDIFMIARAVLESAKVPSAAKAI